MTDDYLWWQHGVIYQIYPRSFMDSDADGVGDLLGIINRLDYLAWLGVDALWISPIYPSPMADFGYDVADYTDIHPLFGDMATFDQLLSEAAARGLKIILDYVPNHCSDQHEWFIQSRASKDNPKADWFYWRDAQTDGGFPNNWLSVFGGPAWEWDETRRQYYLHSFLKEQPDLNWFSPEVEEAMLDVIRFWMNKGVAGLRMDVIFFCLKHPDLPDNPPAAGKIFYQDAGGFDAQQHLYDMDWPQNRQAFLSKIRAVLDEYDRRAAIGETVFSDPEKLVPYYGENMDGLHLPFNFTLMALPWDELAFRTAIQRYYAILPDGAWPNFVLGSHDEHRLATRYGPENARAAQMLLLTLRGTPTLYYGDEIAMEDAYILPEKEQDPWGKRVPGHSRDPERTPMQWDSSANAGFTAKGVEPWLPVASNYAEVNVAAQAADPHSHLNFTRALLALRREMPALHRGSITFLEDLPDDIMAYTREYEGQKVLVALNFSDGYNVVNLSSAAAQGEILLNTTMQSTGTVRLRAVLLDGHEGLIFKLH